MIITISNQITVENPTDALKRWCKKELVVPNPQYHTKARMGLWLGNTPKNLTLYEVHGDKVILPYGVKFSMPLTSYDVWFNKFERPEKIDYHAKVNLYDYQKDAVREMKRVGYGILQSPAGSGKTQIGIALAIAEQRRCLWLCHTKDLLKQSKDRAEQYIDKSLIGTITDGEVHLGKGMTFATIQTMANLDLEKYKNYWDVIIVDECHRVSGSPTSVTRYQKVLSSLAARHKYGLSATVHRSDGLIKATYALLGEVMHVVPDYAVETKIMKVGIKPIGTSTRITQDCLNTDGTLNYSRFITYLGNEISRTNLIVNNLIEVAQNHSVLVLSDRLNHLAEMFARLPEGLQNKAVMITGSMNSQKGKRKREKALDDMRSGDKRILFATYSLAKEGLDVPRLDRVFLTTPQKDYAVVTQAIGRIDRKFDDKNDAIAYDFVDGNIGYCVNAYKKRCRTYRKNNCYFVKGDEVER